MPEGSALWEASAQAIAGGVAAGEFTALEVLESCLARTAKVEPLIGSYLAVFADAARQRAADLDRRRVAGGALGPLAGVPVALKDNLSLEGAALTCASRILAGYTAPYTASAVERLLAAGAVVLGKTNMDEFAMGSSCENSSYQLTRNPWHLDMVPGGSSGGSAAAVAAGSVPLAFGSDTGGSIRQPAALCGVVGLKPSYGRVSRYGLVAFGSSLDQIGPLARNVGDAALALAVIAGHDPRDSTSSPAPVDDYLAGLEDGLRGVRVGVIREVGSAGLAADSARAWGDSQAALAAAGAELVEVSIPSLEAAIAIYYVIANSEASANLARFDGVRYGRRAAGARELTELYVASRSEGFGAEVKRRIMLGTFALASGYYQAYYGRAQGVLEGLRRQFAAAFEKVDLLATPTTPAGAFALGEKVDDPLSMYLSDMFTVPANLVGLPGIAVPSGFDSRGLPLSLQFLARPFEEAMLLRSARAFERTASFRCAPAFVESTAA